MSGLSAIFAFLVGFIPRAVMQGTPLLLGSTGETLTEKSGNLNLGIPGIMYAGAISGVIGAYLYESGVAADQRSAALMLLIPFVSCLIGSLIMGLIYCFLTVTLRANQNVTGLALTTFGVGFGNFMGGMLVKLSGGGSTDLVLSATSIVFGGTIQVTSFVEWLGTVLVASALAVLLGFAVVRLVGYVISLILYGARSGDRNAKRPRLSLRLGQGNALEAFEDSKGIRAAKCAACVLGLAAMVWLFWQMLRAAETDSALGASQWFSKMFLSYGFMVYLAIIIALIAGHVLKRTRLGLHLRSVGENPMTADAAGINVMRYKYVATCVGSMIAGLGGLYFVMDYNRGVWTNDSFGDRGWLAIALVIFSLWRPTLGILASILFGGLYILPQHLNIEMSFATRKLFEMLPYVVTVVVLIITSMRKKRENQPPASLGTPYFREER